MAIFISMTIDKLFNSSVKRSCCSSRDHRDVIKLNLGSLNDSETRFKYPTFSSHALTFEKEIPVEICQDCQSFRKISKSSNVQFRLNALD